MSGPDRDSSVLLKLEGISKAFGGTKALVGVDFEARSSSVHAIAGENGAGKSTLIKVIMGAVHPDEGRILVRGKETHIADPAAAAALGFAAVHQEPLVYPDLTVLENLFIAHPLRARWGRLDGRAMRERSKVVLQELGADPALVDRRMGELRLGHQQLVLIAQALIRDAKVVIFDEPTSILSATEAENLFGVIRQLRAAGRSVIYISHRLEELAEVADDVTVITDGAVMAKLDVSQVQIPELLRLMAGSESRSYAAAGSARRTASPGPIVMEVSRLSRAPLYSDVSWHVRAGEVLGFYGQVGAGRSEMAQGIFGSLTPQSGTISLQGRPVRFSSPARAIAAGVGYVPEDRKVQGIFASQPIVVNAVTVVLPKLIGMWRNVRPVLMKAVANRFAESLRIKMGSIEDPISALSGGGQQKVVLGRSLAQDLKVLIVDEPTRGIDVATKEEFHRIIRDVAASGIAVVVISSDLPEVLAVSDRIAVMKAGRLVKEISDVAATTPEEVLEYAVGMPEPAAVG